MGMFVHEFHGSSTRSGSRELIPGQGWVPTV